MVDIPSELEPDNESNPDERTAEEGDGVHYGRRVEEHEFDEDVFPTQINGRALRFRSGEKDSRNWYNSLNQRDRLDTLRMLRREWCSQFRPRSKRGGRRVRQKSTKRNQLPSGKP